MADNKSFESTLHDIVYSIDSGTGLKIIRVTLYFLVLLVIVMLYTASQFRGLNSEESMDYAQLGRNFSLQDGLVTKCVRPLSMWKMSEHNPDAESHVFGHPDLVHPPAYPALLSAGFKLFDLMGIDAFVVPEIGQQGSMNAEKWVILTVNHFFAILTGWLLFLLGKRLFSHEIGLIGMSIYFLSDLVWRDSISGLNLSMAIFLIMASFYNMIVSMLNKRAGETKARWMVPFLFSIVFAALAFLTRYISIAIVPGLCLFAWMMGGRFRGGTRFAVVFILVYLALISPWLVRNYQVCGNVAGMVGYSALADTPLYPGNSLARDLSPSVTISDGIQTLKHKWVLNYSGENQAVVTSMGGGILMAFFLVTFFYHFIRPQVNCLRWSIGVSLLLTVVLAGFFSDSSISMIHAFWPFVILYALAFFYILIDRLDLGVRLYNIGLKCLLVMLSMLPFILTLMPPHVKSSYPPYLPSVISDVSELLNPREVMCTDMPWATAWYGDRVSILLPKDTEQFFTINDEKRYISGLYITTITKNKPFVRELLSGPEQSWLPLVTGRTPRDFPLKQGTSLLGQDQVFYSDRNRWSSASESAE
jgi:hypothetical protein